MSRKRHRPEEIVATLRQVEVLTAQGQSVAEAIRSMGVTEVSSGTSCLMGRSSTLCGKRRSSSRAGDVTPTVCARMPRSATGHRLQRCSCPPSQPGRLRSPDQLCRPGCPW